MEEQNQTPAPASEKKSHKKVLLILLGITVLVIVLVAGGYFLFNNLNSSGSDSGDPGLSAEEEDKISAEPTRTPSAKANFTCADDKTIEVTFFNEGDFPSADLVLKDGSTATTITLYQVESGSGAKYANTDESMVFWNTGNEAFVEENGEETYSNCVENS